MGITALIADFATAFIGAIGYPGVFLLMVLESMVFPVPSEAVMPFAGFLVAQGTFSFWIVVVVSTAASLVGSLLSYALGRFGGIPLIARYGRYLLLEVGDLERTIDFFRRRGDVTIFLGRLIPVVRHLISIPAGIGRMSLTRFMFYTVLGAAMWNAFLTWIGMLLRDHWAIVMSYSHVIDLLVVGALVAGVVWFVMKHR